nr:MAG TPA: hypothetical protein [Caudoviricetes sp.]
MTDRIYLTNLSVTVGSFLFHSFTILLRSIIL